MLQDLPPYLTLGNMTPDFYLPWYMKLLKEFPFFRNVPPQRSGLQSSCEAQHHEEVMTPTYGVHAFGKKMITDRLFEFAARLDEKEMLEEGEVVSEVGQVVGPIKAVEAASL